MCAFSLALDKLRITSPSMGLEISFDSSIAFQCSDTSFHSLDPTQLFNLLYSGNVWVSRGRGFRLNFTVYSDGKLPGPSSWTSITENLGRYLRDAPLWSQVSLDARLELPPSGGKVGVEHRFSICLQHALSGSTSCQTSDPLLSAAASIQAPAIVSRLEMMKVDIVLSIKHLRKYIGEPSNGIRSLTGPICICGRGHKTKEECHLVYALAEDDLFQSNLPSLSYATCFIPDNHIDNYVHEDSEMLDGSRPLPVKISLPPSASSLHQTGSLRNEDTKDSSSKFAMDSSNTKLICAQNVTEFALRHLIGGRQTKNQPGIKIMKPQPAQSLSQIAPALWSPGFLQAMSQRSRYLPIISHTISNAILQNVQSPSLKRKLISLSSTQPGPLHSDLVIDGNVAAGSLSNSDATTAYNLRHVVEARLWTMMQLSLYDPLSARRLLPHPAATSIATAPTKEATTDSDINHYSSQGTESKMQHQETDRFSFLADDFGTWSDDILSETSDDDFEALLEDDAEWPARDEFQDLFATGTFPLEDSTNDAMFEDDGDIDMVAHEGVDSWAFAPEMGYRRPVVEDQFGRADMQIDNQSMLI